MKSTTLLDTAQMFDQLVTAAAGADVTAVQDLHADSRDEVPIVYWTAANNGQYDHGLWQVTLILRVIADASDAFNICKRLYANVTAWNVPGEGVVHGVGGVLEVDDSAVFDRIFEGVMHGKYLAQYNGSFTISIQEM